jgi:hypothetical protein
MEMSGQYQAPLALPHFIQTQSRSEQLEEKKNLLAPASMRTLDSPGRGLRMIINPR